MSGKIVCVCGKAFYKLVKQGSAIIGISFTENACKDMERKCRICI